MAIDLGGGLESVRLTGCAGGVLSEREETVALNLKQAGFDRAGTTKPPHEASMSELELDR
jgi:hypothetical protein